MQALHGVRLAVDSLADGLQQRPALTAMDAACGWAGAGAGVDECLPAFYWAKDRSDY